MAVTWECLNCGRVWKTSRRTAIYCPECGTRRIIIIIDNPEPGPPGPKYVKLILGILLGVLVVGALYSYQTSRTEPSDNPQDNVRISNDNVAPSEPVKNPPNPTQQIPSQLGFNIETDKRSYTIGETIIVNGKVPNIEVGRSVIIFIMGPDKTIVEELRPMVRDDGMFTASFKPQGSKDVIGSWEVKASYMNKVASTTFNIVNP